ncbi:hypothetical protein Q0812_02560 [Brevundimonas sp. 2R-24]|uniref:Uncharacterized protein n=1 Tax=Peiella sedimenti TaxID=3061083 RepID=A0ABT8SKZ3_9CAUL|nr:hypothetical protein [Caulobacteraceae bacterium XZ-24]
MSRNAIARAAARKLLTAESAIDRALEATGELTSVLPSLRLQGNFACEVGHQAVVELAQAITSLADARGRVVAAHKTLNGVKQDFGIGLTGVPDKPEDGLEPRGLAVIDGGGAAAA